MLHHSSPPSPLARYRKRAHRLQNVRIALNDTEREYFTIRKKHLRVCGDVQKLQNHAARRKTVAQAIARQEEIVLRLEALIVTNGSRIDPATSVRSWMYVPINRPALCDSI